MTFIILLIYPCLPFYQFFLTIEEEFAQMVSVSCKIYVYFNYDLALFHYVIRQRVFFISHLNK